MSSEFSLKRIVQIFIWNHDHGIATSSDLLRFNPRTNNPILQLNMAFKRPITTSMQYKPDHFFRPIRSDLTSSIPIGRWYLVGFQTGSYLFTLLIYLLLILVIILLLLNIIYFLFFRNHRTSKFPEKSQLHLRWRFSVIKCSPLDSSMSLTSLFSSSLIGCSFLSILVVLDHVPHQYYSSTSTVLVVVLSLYCPY